ncbi:MAG: hypothetical protein AABY96_10270 [Nitrospirota bacterium]
MNRLLSTRQIWDTPVVLTLVSAGGLLSALLGDGIWDVFSWAALSAPVIVIGWYVARPAV